jgi:hypothetical protein
MRKWVSYLTSFVPPSNVVMSGKDKAFALPTRLHVPDPRSDRDTIIAATALVHGMTVVTRNIDDFKRTGVRY